MKRLMWAALALTFHTACSGVSGEVGGEAVPTATAYYVEEDNYYGDDGVYLVYLDEDPNGCENQATWQDELNGLDWLDLLDPDTYDDLEDLWADLFPEDFWRTTITIRVDDVDDANGGLSLDGTDFGYGVSDDDEFYVTMDHFDQYLEFDDLTDVTNLVWGDNYRSDGGEGSITAHNPGTAIGASLSTEMFDNDGDSEGEVNISFSARRCEDLEDEIF